jgi:hypothetical protein
MGVIKSTVEMGSGGVIYVPSFITIDIGVEGVLRFVLRKLNGCNVGTTD